MLDEDDEKDYAEVLTSLEDVERNIGTNRQVFVDPLFEDVLDVCARLKEAWDMCREIKEMYNLWIDRIDDEDDNTVLSLLYDVSGRLSNLTDKMDDIEYLIAKVDPHVGELRIRVSCPEEAENSKECKELRDIYRLYAEKAWTLLKEIYRYVQVETLHGKLLFDKLRIICEIRGLGEL